MKKLMILAAVALIAGMSQAAMVTWGNASTSKLVGLDGTTPITSGITVTLMYENGMSTGSSVSAINSMNAGVLSTAKWTYQFDTDATTGDKFYLHAVLKVDDKEYEMDIAKDNPFAITATNNGGSETFYWAAGTYGGAMWKETTPDEPEPTSALLMLCGLAGLALRRKRA